MLLRSLFTFLRFLQVKSVQDRVTWLESLIQYYKIPNTCIIHPNELPKEPKIGKRELNKLNKELSMPDVY